MYTIGSFRYCCLSSHLILDFSLEIKVYKLNVLNTRESTLSLSGSGGSRPSDKGGEQSPKTFFRY